MIIQLLMSVCLNVISLLTSPINLPPLPSGVEDSLSYYIDFLTGGINILSCYFNLTYLLTLLGVVLLVDGALLLYKMVMWILRKIPALSIRN